MSYYKEVYVKPPISVKSVASTDKISYNGENVRLTTVLEEMRDDTAENTAGIRKLVSSTTEIENDLVRTKADIQDSFNTVSRDIQAICGDIQRIDTNIDALVDTANDHEGAINQLEELAEVADEKIKRMDGQVETLTEASNDHAARVGSLESDMIAASNDISMNKERLDALESDTDERFEAYGTHVNALERDVMTAKRSIKSLATQVSANKAKIAAVETAQNTCLPLPVDLVYQMITDVQELKREIQKLKSK